MAYLMNHFHLMSDRQQRQKSPSKKNLIIFIDLQTINIYEIFNGLSQKATNIQKKRKNVKFDDKKRNNQKYFYHKVHEYDKNVSKIEQKNLNLIMKTKTCYLC